MVSSPAVIVYTHRSRYMEPMEAGILVYASWDMVGVRSLLKILHTHMTGFITWYGDFPLSSMPEAVFLQQGKKKKEICFNVPLSF